MKKVGVFIFFLFAVTAVFTPVLAQRGRMQIQADNLGSHPSRPGWTRGIKNVVITHSGTRIYCDYAEMNQVTQELFAREKLRIVTQDKTVITGATLNKAPNQDLLVVDKNVVVTTADTTKLYTDRLTYNQVADMASYTTGGKIVSDSTVLTSKIGHHHGKTKAFHCKTDVVITDPSYIIYTDTMQMVDNVVYFFSPTHVYSDSNYLYCEYGWYRPKEKIASLTQNAFVQTKDQKMYGDSIYYEMELDFGEAFNNVVVIDSIRDLIIHSDYALNNKKQGDAWFTKNPVGILISENDSLFLRGDTLRMVYDTNENIHHVLAFYNVLFYRTDLQGACDSLAYVMADSTMTMFGSPIAWSNDDQLTGDTIRLLLSDNKPKQMFLQNHAFIASKGHYEGQFNQIKGVLVEGFFNDSSELQNVTANEKVETIYFVTDDTDNSLIGILKQNSVRMEMTLEQQTISTINYITPDPGTMFTEAELPVADRFLKGFLWQVERRPKSRSDISDRF